MIVLTTINAKWIHPSLALRLLKANLGALEESCEIIEFALRQPLAEKVEPLLTLKPRILGVSVSIWNHLAALELLGELEKCWAKDPSLAEKPVIVLGGPEVSHLPPESSIFKYADYVIRGEGEEAFRTLCENIILNGYQKVEARTQTGIGSGWLVKNYADSGLAANIKSAYHLYTDEDVSKKLIYVESSRGCPFNCEFCLSAVKDGAGKGSAVREFPLEKFLAEMDILIQRGVKTFKFLDRSFNVNVKRAVKIAEFFLTRIDQLNSSVSQRHCVNPSLNNVPFTVHFEMVPSVFPPELIDTLSRFPPGTLRLEIGIQTLNLETAARIGRHCDPEKELETLRLLREKTNAVIHADLIAGLPGEDLVSFGQGFDRLWLALNDTGGTACEFSQKYFNRDENDRINQHRIEIQLGILKLLPGAPLSRHTAEFGMRYNPQPPYEIEETACISGEDIRRIKNFARFWEMIVNRDLVNFKTYEPVFNLFMALSDSLYDFFGRNWGIDKTELLERIKNTFHR